MRIAERYRPGVTPIASLKVRQKWNRLTIALLAISARDKGSLYFSYMNLIARSWALFIYLLSRVALVICGSDAVRASYRFGVFCIKLTRLRCIMPLAYRLCPSCSPLDSAMDAPLGAQQSNI